MAPINEFLESMMEKEPLRSPCIARCKLDHDEICQGCYRTITEIVNWQHSTAHQKQLIIERVTKLREQQDRQLATKKAPKKPPDF